MASISDALRLCEPLDIYKLEGVRVEVKRTNRWTDNRQNAGRKGGAGREGDRKNRQTDTCLLTLHPEPLRQDYCYRRRERGHTVSQKVSARLRTRGHST
jgi:hypothetical protein